MQDPNEDTEWNDVLRAKGIIPEKPKEVELSEEELAAMVDEAAQRVLHKTIREQGDEQPDEDELDELEDDDVTKEYWRKRMAEMQAMAQKRQFGEVINITSKEYKEEINQAGKGIWVVLSLYQDSILACRKLQQIMKALAKKFPTTKFVQSIATQCIPNYPDKNLPTVFIYYEDELKKQWIGPFSFGGEKMTQDIVEWELAQAGAMETELEEDPRIKHIVREVMKTGIRTGKSYGDSDDEQSDDED